VKLTGRDALSGVSWAQVKQTVGAAILAASAGDEIRVAASVYNERIRSKVAAELSVDMVLYNRGRQGAGIFCTAACPMLYNNLIEANENYDLPSVYLGSPMGAAVTQTGWDLDLRFNVFLSNVAESGGALYLDQPRRGTVANNLFLANHAYDRQSSSGGEGGAIWLLVGASPDESLEIFGNTFSDNTATSLSSGEQGGAIAVLPLSSMVTIGNNVMDFNSSGIYQRNGFSTYPVLIRNALYNGAANYVNRPAGSADIVADLLLVDRPAGNFRLVTGSPLVDQGDPACVSTLTDLDRAPRVQDADYSGSAVVDISAYEYSPDFDADGDPDWIDGDDDDDGAVDGADCAALDAATWSLLVDVEDLIVDAVFPTVVSWTTQDVDVFYDVAPYVLVGQDISSSPVEDRQAPQPCRSQSSLEGAMNGVDHVVSPGDQFLGNGHRGCDVTPGREHAEEDSAHGCAVSRWMVQPPLGEHPC
jgi:hypothetical protein